MESVKDRLNYLFDLSKLSNYEIGRITGISEATLSRIRGEKPYSPQNATIMNVVVRFNIPYDWIKFGNGEKPNEIVINKARKTNATDRGPLEGDFEKFITKSGTEYGVVSEGNLRLTVKYVEHKAQAGYLSGWADPDYIDTLPTTIITVKRIHFGDYRVFEVSGDSMDYEGKRAIEEGDSVIGRKVERDFWTESRLHIHEWKEWVIVHDEGIIIKHITSHDVEAGIINCRSYNVDKTIYPDFDLSLERVYEIYNVVKIEKNR